VATIGDRKLSFIDMSERESEMIDAAAFGNISSAVASTLDGLLLIAARGELATFTKDGLKPLSDYEREQCAIARAAISQHFNITILAMED
jgi:hypothetical protein